MPIQEFSGQHKDSHNVRIKIKHQITNLKYLVSKYIVDTYHMNIVFQLNHSYRWWTCMYEPHYKWNTSLSTTTVLFISIL